MVVAIFCYKKFVAILLKLEVVFVCFISVLLIAPLSLWFAEVTEFIILFHF